MPYDPKNEMTSAQALKVQELLVSGSDHGLYTISGGSTYVYIREPVSKVFLARVKVDATNLFTELNQANLSIVDADTLTTAAPNDKGAIKLNGISALANNDVIVLEYSVVEDA